MSTLNLQVSQNVDDGYEIYNPNYYTFSNSGVLFSNNYASSQRFQPFFRFLNVTIPNGATINSAYLVLKCSQSNLNGWSSPAIYYTHIYGIAEDNCAEFSSVNRPGLRTLTSNNNSWQIPAIVSNTEYTSPDLKTVIQEIIDRAGWSSGNALGLYAIVDTMPTTSTYLKGFYNYSQNINYSAKLNIDYTYSTGGIDHRITINDSIGLVDFIGKAPVRKPSDNLVITDSISKKITVNILESMTLNDRILVNGFINSLLVTPVDTIDLTESIGKNFIKRINDSLSLIDKSIVTNTVGGNPVVPEQDILFEKISDNLFIKI